MIDLVFAIAFAIGIVAGTIAHEGGHLVSAVVMRCRPKIVCLGSGRQVFQIRVGGGHLVVRAVPLGGRVMIVPMGRERRNAMAVFLAAGPAGNVLAIVATLLAWFAWGGGDIASGTAALAIIGAQAAILAFALVPMADAVQPDRSDGALLRAWARGRDVYLLDRVYAPLVSHLPPQDRPARTEDFAEALFHSVRSDRLEPWGRQQAIAGLQAVLARGLLNPYERMATLKRLLRYLAEEEPPAASPWGAPRHQGYEDLEGGMSE